MPTRSHSRTRSLADTPAGWKPLPGWYRDEAWARKWVETWSSRGDGFVYEAFAYPGRRRNGEATRSFKVCRKVAAEPLEWAI